MSFVTKDKSIAESRRDLRGKIILKNIFNIKFKRESKSLLIMPGAFFAWEPKGRSLVDRVVDNSKKLFVNGVGAILYPDIEEEIRRRGLEKFIDPERLGMLLKRRIDDVEPLIIRDAKKRRVHLLIGKYHFFKTLK